MLDAAPPRHVVVERRVQVPFVLRQRLVPIAQCRQRRLVAVAEQQSHGAQLPDDVDVNTVRIDPAVRRHGLQHPELLPTDVVTATVQDTQRDDLRGSARFRKLAGEECG